MARLKAELEKAKKETKDLKEDQVKKQVRKTLFNLYYSTIKNKIGESFGPNRVQGFFTFFAFQFFSRFLHGSGSIYKFHLNLEQ